MTIFTTARPVVWNKHTRVLTFKYQLDSMAKIKLTDVVETDSSKTGVWVQYKSTTFHVKIAYYGKPQMLKLSEQAKTAEFDLTTMKTKEGVDSKKFLRLYACTLIQDWKGLTLEVLRTMVPIKTDVAGEMSDTDEFPCEDEYKVFLLDNCLEFDQWVGAMAKNVELFSNEKRAAEVKN